MIARPFAVRCLETATQETLDVAIRFSAMVTPSDDGLLLTQRLMSHFTRIAANGGLAGPSIRPVESTLSLMTAHIATDMCAWRFDNVQIAPDTRTVLENIAQFLHLNVSPVLQLDLMVPLGSRMFELQNTIPGIFPFPPFQYVFEADAAEIVIDIDFQNLVYDENIRKHFVHFWESWLYVSAAGGFETEDFSSRRISIFPAGDLESYPHQISLFMEDISINERAFDVLVNGYHRLHFTSAPLHSLHIY